MPTGTQGTNAREYVQHQTHYLGKDFTKANAGQTLSLGFVPAGGTVLRACIIVKEVFAAGTNNRADIGTVANPDDFASDLALGTAGVIRDDEMATAVDAGPYAVDTEIKVVVDVTGTASATGIARAVVEYCLADQA